MPTFTITATVDCNDEGDAAEVVSEIVNALQDAQDSDELPEGVTFSVDDPVEVSECCAVDATALAQRIEELETAVKDVLGGTMDEHERRREDGMNSYGKLGPDAERWKMRLQGVLEQKP